MRKLLFALIFGLLPCAGVGQTTNNPAQASTGKPAATSPELTEATRLSHEAVRLFDQEKFGDALSPAKRALELREKALGPDHELVATSLYNVAGIYRASKRYADAESLYKRALKILEKRFGVEGKNLTDTLEQLGLVCFVQGDTGDAQKLYLRSLAIKQKTLGAENLETARTLTLLGKMFERSDNLARAAEYFKRSLAISEKALAPDHPDLAEALENCVCASMLNGQVDEGRQYQERANKIRKSAVIETFRPQVGLLRGFAIRMVDPKYPSQAKNQMASGLVVVEVTVDECGRVQSAKVRSGPVALYEASIEAARRWRFTRTRVGGRPVKVVGTIAFNFQL